MDGLLVLCAVALALPRLVPSASQFSDPLRGFGASPLTHCRRAAHTLLAAGGANCWPLLEEGSDFAGIPLRVGSCCAGFRARPTVPRGWFSYFPRHFPVEREVQHGHIGFEYYFRDVDDDEGRYAPSGRRRHPRGWHKNWRVRTYRVGGAPRPGDPPKRAARMKAS